MNSLNQDLPDGMACFEHQIIKLKQFIQLLSGMNKVLVRRLEPRQIFSEICDIAVQDGGFALAWIGLQDQKTGIIRVLAKATNDAVTGMADSACLKNISVDDFFERVMHAMWRIDDECGDVDFAAMPGIKTHLICNNLIEDSSVSPDVRAAAKSAAIRAMAVFPFRVNNQMSGTLHLYATDTQFFDETEIQLLVDLALDISYALEVNQTDARLKQAASVIASTNEGIMVTDVNNSIVMVNRAFSDLTGYTEQEALGRSPSMLSSKRHSISFYQAMWSAILTTGHWKGEVWNRHKNGEAYPELLSINSISDDNNQVTHYVGVFADISKIKDSESRLEHLAHHDVLTGLPNRLLLFERLDHALDLARRENRHLALLMLDLDRFKDVNDSYGHAVGDNLLMQVASRLLARLRGTDTLARMGGDEFTVLLEEVHRSEDVAKLANDIIAALSQSWQLGDGIEARIGVSIGISLFPEHGSTSKELLQHADAAMYRAKEEGRGRFAYYSHELTVAARARIDLEVRLRRAITNNELHVYYQPQLDVATGRIIGAEAQVAWYDPVHGLIPPASFISVAKEIGLISMIGEFVLKQACRQGRSWADAGFAVNISVNVSSKQFLQPDFCAMVATVLEETGFSPACLELELKENELMVRYDESIVILAALRLQGIRLALDDFGTGCSSLAYLKHFPLDVLKIDRNFVAEISQNQDDGVIAATIIAMAHILHFKVLAEGVETEQQLAFLEQHGCDIYQGGLASEPMEPEMFAELLNASVKVHG